MNGRKYKDGYELSLLPTVSEAASGTSVANPSSGWPRLRNGIQEVDGSPRPPAAAARGDERVALRQPPTLFDPPVQVLK